MDSQNRSSEPEAQSVTPSEWVPAFWITLGWVLVAAVISLRLEGHRWWCQLGDWSLWSTGIHGEHTSQHLLDPYSVTHVLHGLLFYALFRLVADRLRWEARLVLALGLECVWEVLENSTTVIGRYRAGTIALGYNGDSVLNSMGDIASCVVGFLIARRLPVGWSIALFLVADGLLLLIYRDNLLLNMIMLVHPFDAIKAWQTDR